MILNGIAKSGNHALQKACALLGVDLKVNHTFYADKAFGEKCLMLVRHPRNVICSQLQDLRRHRITPIGLQHGIADVAESVCKAHLDFLGWLTDPDTTVIRYENLMGSSAPMLKIAGILGVGYVPGSWEKLPGGTGTWSGHPSDWTAIWTAKAQEIWLNAGGLKVEALYGYSSPPTITPVGSLEITSLKMTDGKEQYGIVILKTAGGTLDRYYEIDAIELQAIKAGKPLPGNVQGLVVGKPLRKNEALACKDGRLLVKIGEKINSSGVIDCDTVYLYPEEWTQIGGVIGVDSSSIAVIPELKGAM